MNGNRDFRDLLQCLNEAGAKYLIVGAYAVLYHADPRFTKDLDVWVEPSPENAQKVWNVLVKFGAPLADLTLDDLGNPDVVFQIGIEPNRIDILMDVEGLRFPEAWENRAVRKYDDQAVFVLSHDDTIRAKKIAGRDQDLLDVKNLERAKKGEKMNELSDKPRERVIMARVSTREQHNDRSFDLEFWERVGDVGRIAAAWQMVREVQLIQGKSGELPRMQKSVARVVRRSEAKKSEESSNA